MAVTAAPPVSEPEPEHERQQQQQQAVASSHKMNIACESAQFGAVQCIRVRVEEGVLSVCVCVTLSVTIFQVCESLLFRPPLSMCIEHDSKFIYLRFVFYDPFF